MTEFYRDSSDCHLEGWMLQHPFNVLSPGHSGIYLKGWGRRLPGTEKGRSIVQQEKYSLCCKAAGAKDTTGFPVKDVIRPSSGYDQNQQSVKSSALLSSRKNRIPQSFPWSSEVFCLAQNCSQKDGWGCSPLWPYAVPPDSSKQHKYILLVI